MTEAEFAEFAIVFILLLAVICHSLWRGRQARKYQEELRNITAHPLYAVPPPTAEISATINSDNYLTADQVAAMLQVSKTTVYSWANAGYIPALKIRGGSQKNVWRFSRQDIERWIADQKQPVTAKDLFASKESKE